MIDNAQTKTGRSMTIMQSIFLTMHQCGMFKGQNNSTHISLHFIVVEQEKTLIYDVIKQNESKLPKKDFEVQPIKAFNFDGVYSVI